jgi:hypothetical protein
MRWRSELVDEKEKNQVSEFAGQLWLTWMGCSRLPVHKINSFTFNPWLSDRLGVQNRQRGVPRVSFDAFFQMGHGQTARTR